MLESIINKVNPRNYFPDRYAKSFVDAHRSDLVYKSVAILIGNLAKVSYKMEIEGLENLEPGLTLVKHQSMTDMFIGASFYPPPIVMAKEDLFFPIFGNILAKCGALPVFRRNKNDPNNAHTYSLHAKALMEGEYDVMFPEGHRSKGEMGRFRDGLKYVLEAYVEQWHKTNDSSAELNINIIGFSNYKPWFKSFRSEMKVKIQSMQWNENMDYETFRDNASNLMATLSGLPTREYA